MPTSQALELRTLRVNELPAVHDLVLDAFSVYPVRMQPSREQLAAMLDRRGADWSISVGAFAASQLIGAIMVAIDVWPGELLSAYIVITGVRRGWQGRGVLAGMFEPLRRELASRGVERIQLEVLIDNPNARRAYERLGFVSDRALYSFSITRVERPQRFSEELGLALFEREAAVALAATRARVWSSFWSWTPAWTSSSPTVARARSIVVIEALWEQELAGYAVVDVGSGEVLQLAVDPRHRRLGIGTELVRGCLAQVGSAGLRALNLDGDGDSGETLAFARAIGGTYLAVQHELVLLGSR